MSDVIEFFYNPMSRARMAQWALEEIGEPFELRFVDFKKPSPELLALNPMGKVPTIVHKGVPIFETSAILTYLGDAFPAKKLAPPIEHPKRGEYLRWMFFQAASFEPAVLEKRSPRVEPLNPVSLGFGSYDSVMNTIEKGIEAGPYLLGDWFTMADLYLASQLEWCMMFKSVDERPAFVKYVKRCTNRPAYLRAKEKAETMIREMQAK